MPRLCVRKKRTVILSFVLLFVLGSSVLLSGTMRQLHTVELATEYDYDIGDSAMDIADAKKVKFIRDSDFVQNGAFSIDRKPKGHSEDIMDVQLYHTRVIFNKQEPPVYAKRLAFIKPGKGKDYEGEGDKDESDEYDDYAENQSDDVNSVIQDDGTEEEQDENEYEYWADNPNPVFKPGDFDNADNATKRPPFKFQEVQRGEPERSHMKEEARHAQPRTNPLSNSRVLQSKGRGDQADLQSEYSSNPVIFDHSKDPAHITRIHTLNNKNSQQNVAKAQQPNQQNISPYYRVDGSNRSLPLYEQPATQLQMPQLLRQPGKVHSKHGFLVVRDHIYWSTDVQNFVPKGVSDTEVREFSQHVKQTAVTTMQDPQWNRCGRPKNQYVVLADGTPLCARYRDPHNKLIQGEVLSFYLARMLGLDNIPIVVLSQVNTSAPQWQYQDIQAAHWHEGKIVALIQWIKGLESERSRVKMPAVILSAYENGVLVNSNHPALLTMTPHELGELLQWGNMILFDYITGHYDRVASMQDGADRENKPSIMSESIRNLRKDWHTAKMWLIDNESGLFDAYELIYRGKEMGQRFVKFHQRMLQTMCIFQKDVVSKITELAMSANPDLYLVNYARKHESLYDRLPQTAEYKLFKKNFHTRLKDVTAWIQECKTR